MRISPYRCFLFALVLSGTPGSLFPQILPFKNYTTRDGLLSNYTLSLCADSHGYLWIGTNDGLSRYDGISFRNYTVADGLPFSRINYVTESPLRPGVLWIGTNGGGVSRFENGRFVSYRVGPNSWTNSINKVVEDHTGRVWAGTSSGAFFLDDSTFVPFLPDTIAWENTTVIEIPDSAIWIITGTRVYSYSPKRHLTHRVPLAPPRSAVFMQPYVDHQQRLWMTTSAGTLLRIVNETVAETIRTGRGGCSFIAEGDSGTFWVGLPNGVLMIEQTGRSGQRLASFSGRNGIRDTIIIDGVVDREGDLWLASYSGGLSRLVDQSVITFPIRPPEYPPNNSTALSDRSGHLWICSEGSLWEFWHDEELGWRNLRHPELAKGKERCVPRSICSDEESNFWILSTDNKIFEFRPQRSDRGVTRLILRKVFKPGVHFPKGVPMFVFRDDNGLLWCSMMNDLGVFVLDPRKAKPYLRTYTSRNGMPDESVRAIYQDRRGNLWFGGYSDGLSMLPADESLDGTFRLFTTAQGLPSGAIRSIIDDANGTLWVGTRYGGLAYLQDSVFHAISVKEGLLSTAVWCLSKGLHGDLWVGTQLGMQSLTPVSNVLAAKKELGGNPVFACGQTSGGLLWLVSPAGLMFYNPARDRRNPVPPPIVITHFEVTGVDYPTAGSFRLSSNQDHCVIEVAGISLRDEEGLRYQYRLLGANDEWVPPGTNRTFVFASLAPGTYTFMARAINSNGIVSAAPAQLQFTILPPFWKQWWFLGGTALCLILLAVVFVRLRLTRLLAIERLRARIATDLHDDIGSGLTRIAILSDVAYRQVQSGRHDNRAPASESAEVLRGLEKVRGTARGLIETMSDVVWAIDPSHDSFERLVQRLRSFAYELCDAKNIRLAFHVDDKVLSAKMSSEGMRNVLLFSKEALNNIARHSDCSSVELTIGVGDQTLALTIVDDGKGFDPGTVDLGNGLLNMRKRTEQAGGTFAITSKAGQGTRVAASFPLLRWNYQLS